MNNKSIIIEDNLHRLGSEEFRHCIAHVLCEAGSYVFQYNGENFVLEAGQTMIIPYQEFIEVVVPSPYLQATCIYLTPKYAEYCTPRSNYGIRGGLWHCLLILLCPSPKSSLPNCNTIFSK